ncbi:hypothetical protein Tco_1335196 [Tanacetum coccineum]
MAALNYKDDHKKASATVRTLEDGSQELVATVDGNEVVVNESSVRTHLHLDDEGDILGIQTTDPTPKAIGVFTSKLFANIKLKFEGDHIPLLAAMLPGDHADAGAVVADGDIPPPPNNVGVGAAVAAGEEDVPSPHYSPRPASAGPSTSIVETAITSPRPEATSNIETTTSPRQPSPSLIRDHTLEPFGPSPRPDQLPPSIFHKSEPETSTFVEDDNVRGDYHFSLNRSNEAIPNSGQPAGGAEEPDALTILSSKLDRCMDQIGALETELKETKKTLGDAVLTLIGRVKNLEVQLKKSKRKVMLSDSEDEEGVHKDAFDMEALQDAQSQATDISQVSKRTRSKRRLRKLSDAPAFDKFRANASAGGVGISAGSGAVSTDVPAASIPTVSKEIPADSTFVPADTTSVPAVSIPANSEDIPPVSTSVPAVATSTIPAGTSTNPTAAQSSKGKEQIVEDPTPDMERIFKDMEDERLGEDMAKKVQAEEDAQWARTQAESQSKRQQDVNAAAMFYTEDDWLNILPK